MCAVKMMRSSTDKGGNLLSAASHRSSREDKLREHIEVNLELSNTIQPSKIRRLIREFGSLPLESRPLAWRYLLKTPNNSIHFRRIVVESCSIKLPTTWNEWIKDNNDISKFIDMSLKRPLLERGFSQVLSFEQWAQLWDHFLCNHLSLTIAACVAYVCVTESSLRTFSENNKEDLQ
ncbi:hypothetical protein B566_EDAN012684, partial [Ephemera danica]